MVKVISTRNLRTEIDNFDYIIDQTNNQEITILHSQQKKHLKTSHHPVSDLSDEQLPKEQD